MRLLSQYGHLLDKDAFLEKKNKFKEGRSLERGCLLGTVLNIFLFKRVPSHFIRTIVSYQNLIYSYPV